MRSPSEFDIFVENHLNLQVRISYADHHEFLLRHGLAQCTRVLDVGTGNGVFASRLAQDHPGIHFVGIDKRKPYVDRCVPAENFQAAVVDMFSRTDGFDLSPFDGFLMRYFLLHVDHSQKILELLKRKARAGARLWVIDLDWTKFECDPPHPDFDKLTELVKHFCAKISKDSLGGQRVVPLMREVGFRDIRVESVPFSARTIPLRELVLYLKQEVVCYAKMSGAPLPDEVIRFIEQEVGSGKVDAKYGMILASATIA